MVGTKVDLVPKPPAVPPGVDLAVSGVTGEGIEELAQRIARLVALAQAEEPPREPYVVLRPARETFVVSREGDRFRVVGPRVERWVAEADLDDARQVVDLQRRLVRAGVERRLQEAGARRGDEVLIGGTTFEFIPEGEVRTSGAGADGRLRLRRLHRGDRPSGFRGARPAHGPQGRTLRGVQRDA